MIYDCFLFMNEWECLEIRLHELMKCSDWVTHVLIESNVTFTGVKKQLYFDNYKKKFEKWPNIVRIVVDDMPEQGTAWDREAHQRNYIAKALEFCNAGENDTVIISDSDEIPKAAAVNYFLENSKDIRFSALMMKKYDYRFNLFECEWDRARIMLRVALNEFTPEHLRNSGYTNKIEEGGWHFSYLGSFDKNILKLSSFSHSELKTYDNLIKMSNEQNFWNNNALTCVELDDSFPEYLMQNRAKFSKLIKFCHDI